MDTLEQNTMRMHALSFPTRSKHLKYHASPRRALVLVSAYSLSLCCAAGYLSFHPMAQCVVHALKGLACRALGLLTHAEVTRYTICFSIGPKFWYPVVLRYVVVAGSVCWCSCEILPGLVV